MRKMNCLPQLQTCQASCCRVLPFFIDHPTEAELEYYERHTCKTVRMTKGRWMVVVPQVCTALTKDNLCGVHNTDRKPLLCSKLDYGKTEGFFITENCLLENEPGVLKLP